MIEFIFKGSPKRAFLCLIPWIACSFYPAALEAQEQAGNAVLARANTGAYKTIERSDWSRYDNGKYTGHVYREVRATLNPQPINNARGFSYRGNFFVLEETLRDMRQSARAVDNMIPVSFQIFPSGDIRIDDDRGFPSLRGFPSFPSEPVRPGSRWQAEGVKMADPLNGGEPVAVPIIAEYEYKGTETYNNIPVYRISAQYAVRYPVSGAGRSLAGAFRTLQGSHSVEILLRTADGLPLMMRDNMDETYSWADGNTVRFRGFTLTFGEGTIPLNPDRVIASIGRTLNGGAGRGGSSPGSSVPGGSSAGTSRGGTTGTGNAAGSGQAVASLGDRASLVQESTKGKAPIPEQTELETSANIAVTTVPEGIRLTVKDIRFAPDSDEFLPAEYSRLDIIAQALKEVPDRTFLVEGHTAAVGRPQGEMELSVQRAKRMVDELVKRGIDASRFLYKGWGGTKPLGDNSTDPGRALNRRVEITILE
jgi:outer membrane protein OmpA-like peptidoglycan-associated protein